MTGYNHELYIAEAAEFVLLSTSQNWVGREIKFIH